MEKKYKILLLTNRDSDNVGDQVIEACDIALIKAAMKNLNIADDAFEINSHAAGMITKKYLATRDERELKKANKLVKAADLIIFGGAPLFNYQYQDFYERTAITLELAEQYKKPVLFSAIGVEGYDGKNPKCQRLKKALNLNCVKQITTRDDLVSLQKYKKNDQMRIEKVSDPAVFTSNVFKHHKTEKKVDQKKKVGLFVLRSNGFQDNNVIFSREDSAMLWKETIRELTRKGYDYEVLTSGHFGDEAFMDFLITRYGIKAQKCVFNMNTPERLIEKISSYDAVISCRLHPSILSFSLDVPSIGIVWNEKVTYFYESIGYEDRAVDVKEISAEKVVERVEAAMAQGVCKDRDYLMSVYRSLFSALQRLLSPGENTRAPYSYAELETALPAYPGTSEKELEQKLKRKFRRAYGTYNDLFEKNLNYEKKRRIRNFLRSCMKS